MLEDHHHPPEAPVSLFSYSDENQFRTMDTSSKLCGEEPEVDSIQESQIEQLSSKIILFFLSFSLYIYTNEFYTVRFNFIS